MKVRFILKFLFIVSGNRCWLSKCIEDFYFCIYCILRDQLSGSWTFAFKVASKVKFWFFFMDDALSFLQLEDGTLNLILDILCNIYRGEVWMYSN